MKHALTTLIYYALKPVAIPIATRGIEVISEGSFPQSGPRLLLMTHLFGSDPYVMASQLPQHVHGIYATPQKKDRLHSALFKATGNMHKDDLKLDEKICEVWGRDETLAAFYEGDVPGAFKSSKLPISQFPLSSGGLHKLLKRTDSYLRDTGRAVTIIPAAQTYSVDTPQYRGGTTLPKDISCTVKFGNAFEYAPPVRKNMVEVLRQVRDSTGRPVSFHGQAKILESYRNNNLEVVTKEKDLNRTET